MCRCFFVLSGIVFSGGERKLVSLMKRCSMTLLLPYYIFTAGSILLYMSFGNLTGRLLDHMPYTTKEILNLSLTGYSPTNRPLWFLQCLFIAEILIYGCIQAENNAKHRYILRGAVVSLAMLGTAVYVRGPHGKVVFAADKAVALLPFFYMGYSLKTWVRKACSLRKLQLGVLSLVLLGLGMIFGLYLNGKIEYRGLVLGNIWIFYLTAGFSAVGIIGLCRIMPQVRLLAYVGRNTMPILLMHKFPVIFFQTVCPYVKDYLANGSVVWSLIVTRISVAMCCLAGALIQRICPFLLGMSSEKSKGRRLYLT